MTKDYVKGFSFQNQSTTHFSYNPYLSDCLVGITLELIFDHSETIILTFRTLEELRLKENTYNYQLLSVDENIFLLTIHMLKEEPERNLTLAIDLNTFLTTKVDSIITKIKKGSTHIVEGTNLVKRNIDFGYINQNKIPFIRHYFSDDLVDHGFAYTTSPQSLIHYHIHSTHKITYYQKKFPNNGNPIDRDGVGYGELDMIRISESIYLLTFTKHSHGNQPILLWNQKSNYIVANFFGLSRRLHIPFLVTGSGYTKNLY